MSFNITWFTVHYELIQETMDLHLSTGMLDGDVISKHKMHNLCTHKKSTSKYVYTEK